MRKIILASKSIHRKKLLNQIGLKFRVQESKYKEDMDSINDPYVLVKFLALNKARDVGKNHDDAIIIGADTFIVFRNKFIGKPKTDEEAKKILRDFSGKTHKIISGYAIIDTKTKNVINNFGEAFVKFRDLSDIEIEDYVALGESKDKAGAYGLMGKAAVLIDSIQGDFYSVIGLPLNKIFIDLKSMGVNVFEVSQKSKVEIL